MMAFAATPGGGWTLKVSCAEARPTSLTASAESGAVASSCRHAWGTRARGTRSDKGTVRRMADALGVGVSWGVLQSRCLSPRSPPAWRVPRQVDDRPSWPRRTCREGAARDDALQYVEQALDVAVPIIGRPDRGSSALTRPASDRGVTEIPQGLRETRGVAFAKHAAAAASLDDPFQRRRLRCHDRQARRHIIEDLVGQRGVELLIPPMGNDPHVGVRQLAEGDVVRHLAPEGDYGGIQPEPVGTRLIDGEVLAVAVDRQRNRKASRAQLGHGIE